MKKSKLVCSFLVLFLAISIFATPAVSQVEESERQRVELRFKCYVLDWDTISVDAGYAIEEALEEVGIKFDIVELTDEVFYDLIYEGGYYDEAGEVADVLRDFEVYEMSSGYGPAPSHVYYRTYSKEDRPWGDNHGYIHNDTLDGWLEKSNNATTTAELKAALNQVQAICAELVTYVPLFVSDDSHAIRKEWQGYLQLPGGIFTSFNKWTYLNISAPGTDTFRMAYPSDVSQLDPFSYTDARSGWFMRALYDTLLIYDDELQPIPWLAESFSRSVDGKTYTFTLREGVKWHDGTDVTPEDVKFTFDFLKEQTGAPNWVYMKDVTDVSISGQDIIVTYDGPYAWGFDELGTDVEIIPKHIWEGVTDTETWANDHANATKHIACGPFYYSSGLDGGPYVLKRFADYWYDGSAGMPGLSTGPLGTGTYPRIDELTITVVSGSESRILAMNNDDYDSERYETDLGIINKILDGTYANLKLVNTPSQWDYYIEFNRAIKPLDDLVVRQAIMYALDRDAVAQQARGDYATVTDSVIPDCFFPAYYNPNIEKYPYNLAKAKELLDNAGYLDVDGDDIREVPGYAVTPGLEAVMVFVGIFVAVVLINNRKRRKE